MAERLQRQLERLSPGHPALLLPFDRCLPDILEDAIAEVERTRAAKEPQQDEMTKKQQQKGMELKQRIHRKWMEWKEARNQCAKIASYKSQSIMRLLPANWDEDIPQISLSVSDAVIYSSFEHGKQVNDGLELRLWQLESRVSAMNAALSFEAEDPSQQAKYLAYAVHDDLQALMQRIQHLEEALRVSKPKPKQRKVT